MWESFLNKNCFVFTDRDGDKHVNLGNIRAKEVNICCNHMFGYIWKGPDKQYQVNNEAGKKAIPFKCQTPFRKVGFLPNYLSAISV